MGFEFQDVILDEQIESMVLLREIPNLFLDICGDNIFPLRDGLLQFLDVVFGIFEVVSDFYNFVVEPVNFLEQYDRSEVSFS